VRPPLGVDASAPAKVEAGDSLPVLDRTVLAEISGGSLEVERDVLADFASTTRGDLDLLLKAVTAADAVRAGREAHKIKGASRLVGALALSAAAAVVEAAARSGDLNGCAVGADAVRAAFERLEGVRAMHSPIG
jgi:HPt (histidine-containing phosphotransfer) domain-containing protein